MADRRALAAIERIERALDRIEPLARQGAGQGMDGSREELERVREAHDSLRRRVIGAIGQIDELIAAGGRS